MVTSSVERVKYQAAPPPAARTTPPMTYGHGDDQKPPFFVVCPLSAVFAPLSEELSEGVPRIGLAIGAAASTRTFCSTVAKRFSCASSASMRTTSAALGRLMLDGISNRTLSATGSVCAYDLFVSGSRTTSPIFAMKATCVASRDASTAND